MHNGDILGDEGRKALDACVKVKIIGRPETRRYEYNVAYWRLKNCYAGYYPYKSWPFNQLRRGLLTYQPSWLDVDRLLLPFESGSKTYDIIDIYEALVRFDETHYVEKYPDEGPGSDKIKLKDLIDKRRADVERECEEATANPDGRHRYSWLVAQRRVRDCFAGNFAGDSPLLNHKTHNHTYNITEIHDAFVAASVEYDDTSIVNNYRQNKVEADIDRENTEAISARFEKYPSNDLGSDELKKLIDEHRANLEKEYQEDKLKEYKYSRNEAERRVRDCFAGSFISDDTDIFCSKGHVSDIPKIDQIYDIFDIQKAVKYFDSKKLVEKYPGGKRSEAAKQRKLVDEERDGIEREYAEAIKVTDFEHGSGFIIQDHFIITNKHVIESALDDETKKIQINISNAAIGDHELPCEIVHYDVGKDLALLYCKDLNLDGICPLKLSNQSLLPGMQIFSFGFPISHTEETALFVNGYVSGSKKMLSGHTMAVLNCALNSGNSGGPVLCWVKGQLRVVGVATQKHFKDILTLGQRQTIENMREMLQTSVIPELPEFEKSVEGCDIPHEGKLPSLGKTSMFLLTLKLYDALETHSQFNLSNALPGDVVVEFVKKSLEKYNGDCKDELAETVKTF